MFGVGCWWFGTKRGLNLGSFGCILVKVGDFDFDSGLVLG